MVSLLRAEGNVPEPVPLPLPGLDVRVNQFDHERLDVYRAAIVDVCETLELEPLGKLSNSRQSNTSDRPRTAVNSW